MTTERAAQFYLAAHRYDMKGRAWAIYNPNNLPREDLPVIYGFNNGGSPGWYSAVLLTEDGTRLGGHVCSDEGYMEHDLGILEGTRPDRHKTFAEHYPGGYRMEFVGINDVENHSGLMAAYRKNQEAAMEKEGGDESQ